MSQDEFTKLFKYIQENFNSIDEQLKNIASKDDIRRLESIIDGYASKIDDYAKEMAAMQHKIDCLERMIQFLAIKANIPLEQLKSV